MYASDQPHVPGPLDRTIIQCPRCGWTSKEMTREELDDLGHPRWCGREGCDGKASLFVTFAPWERAIALERMKLHDK